MRAWIPVIVALISAGGMVAQTVTARMAQAGEERAIERAVGEALRAHEATRARIAVETREAEVVETLARVVASYAEGEVPCDD